MILSNVTTLKGLLYTKLNNAMVWLPSISRHISKVYIFSSVVISTIIK